MERLGRAFFGMIMAASLWGCASAPGGDWWQTDTFPAPSLNPPHLAEPLVAAQEKISVQPPSPFYTARAGVYYFRSTSQLADAGQALTRIFHRQLLEKRPFLEALLIPEPFASLSEAVEKGRIRGLDVVVLGEVPYFLDGGGLGKSGLQVNLKVVEVKSGRLLWEITDAVTATQRPMVDLWVTETRPRPIPSIYTLAESLAARMCETLKSGSFAADTARR
jgi:hypothetical protein